MIAEGQSFDAVFLDIDWKDDTTGIDMAEKLYQLAPGMSIIYLLISIEKYSEIDCFMSGKEKVDYDALKEAILGSSGNRHFEPGENRQS